MREIVEKKLKTAKTIGILSLVTLGVSVVCTAVGAIIDIAPVLFTGLSLTYPFFVLGIIYLIKYPALANSYKWLKKIGKEHTIEDIDLKAPPQIKAGKIYLGENALFCKQSKVMIPYSEFAWVYTYVARNGLISSAATMVHTKDRKQFMLSCTVEDLKEVIETRVVPVNPRLVVGYGTRQQQRFWAENPKPKK